MRGAGQLPSRRASRDAFFLKSDGPSASPRKRRTSPVDAPSSYPLMTTVRAILGLVTSCSVSAPEPRPPENSTTLSRDRSVGVRGTDHYN